MPRFPACRLIVEAVPQSGAWNMAVDEALLGSAVAGGVPTVRWYRWSKPTLSLGYFQKPDAVPEPLTDPELDVVRRLTGGGAILHHHEWTYSVTLPSLAPLLSHPYQLYDVVHATLIEALNCGYGLSLSLRGEEQTDRMPQSDGASEPWLCYLRQDSHDVCLAGVKLIGSAQRRRRGALLQHGSLLLAESHFAPGISGLYDLAPVLRGAIDVSGEWQGKLASAIGDSVDVSELQPTEIAAAERLFRCSEPIEAERTFL